jgi:hypothetical protein
MKLAGHAAQMGTRRNAYRILSRKPEGKRPIGLNYPFEILFMQVEACL